MAMPEPRKFKTPKQWRAWLERNHDRADEIWIAFAKKASGLQSVTYAEALDEALCFGWIDGLRKAIDDDWFMQRFTPRKREAKWSKVNLDKFARLEAEGKMTDAGRAKKPADVAPPPRRIQTEDPVPDFITRELALHPVAKRHFDKLPPSHRRDYIRWITEAKRDETRARRLAKAIEMLERNAGVLAG
jgi:uncharacterized protein YdeI (YjbR/CyaY-like superfamily)